MSDNLLHKCEAYCDVSYLTKNKTYADSVLICEEHEDGTLWIFSDNYSEQVNKCPICGFELIITNNNNNNNN